MSAPVVHVNLVQRTAPEHLLGWSTLALFAATLVGLGYFGLNAFERNQAASGRLADATRQVTEVQGQLEARRGAEARNATALALRREVDTLTPQSIVAKALIDATGNGERGSPDDFAKSIAATISQSEPGLWLTGLSLSDGGGKLDLSGQSTSAAAVLRYAQRTNAALQPLKLRLDNLEMQPLGGNGSTGAPAGVSFRLF